ncbi:hypothetical protein M9H77_22856 [Catharanthus roseus]|uniref:Uncharacterized protein n=1 Tax=Catharanthus roseus TaxID=4058 RepID=A0ACC0AVQ0_CATRO|nr:hypothetical protein M9H77_22856 [Catharanthus roseus]
MTRWNFIVGLSPNFFSTSRSLHQVYTQGHNTIKGLAQPVLRRISHHTLQWDGRLVESQEGLETKVGLRVDLKSTRAHTHIDSLSILAYVFKCHVFQMTWDERWYIVFATILLMNGCVYCTFFLSYMTTKDIALEKEGDRGRELEALRCSELLLGTENKLLLTWIGVGCIQEIELLRSMYLLTLKRYVQNRAHPEATIANGYLMEKCMNFYARYLNEVETKANRKHEIISGIPDDILDGIWKDIQVKGSCFRRLLKLISIIGACTGRHKYGRKAFGTVREENAMKKKLKEIPIEEQTIAARNRRFSEFIGPDGYGYMRIMGLVLLLHNCLEKQAHLKPRLMSL